MPDPRHDLGGSQPCRARRVGLTGNPGFRGWPAGRRARRPRPSPSTLPDGCRPPKGAALSVGRPVRLGVLENGKVYRIHGRPPASAGPGQRRRGARAGVRSGDASHGRPRATPHGAERPPPRRPDAARRRSLRESGPRAKSLIPPTTTAPAAAGAAAPRTRIAVA